MSSHQRNGSVASPANEKGGGGGLAIKMSMN